MPADYTNIMREMNREYQEVAARAQELREQNQISFTRLGYFESYPDDVQAQAQKIWQEVIDVAMDITDSYVDNSFNVSQVGDYQFWSDKDEMAIVNVRTGHLVAYAQTGGLVPKRVPDHKIPSIRDKDNLMGKIVQNNPTLIIDTNNAILEQAYDFIKPLDPIKRAREIEKKELNLDRLLEIVDRTIDRSILALSKFKGKCRNIANNITANKAMRQTAAKFDEAWRKTEEDSYNIGDYEVSKTNDVYRVTDLDGNLVFSYKSQDGQLELLKKERDQQKLEEALAQISRSPAVGDANKKYQYNAWVSESLEGLSVFPYGKHELEDGGLLLVKQGENLTLKDADGRKLLVRDEGKESNRLTDISQKQLEQVRRSTASFKHELEQAERVAVAAEGLAEYLRQSGTTKIEKSQVFCQYDPQTRILTYREKSEPGNYLQAKKRTGGKWENIPGKSKISEEGVADLQRAVETLKDRQLRQKQRKKQRLSR